MTRKCFLAVHFKPVQCREYNDFIVHTLTRKPLLIRRRCNGWHRMHGRISYVFHVDWYIPVQKADIRKKMYLYVKLSQWKAMLRLKSNI